MMVILILEIPLIWNNLWFMENIIQKQVNGDGVLVKSLGGMDLKLLKDNDPGLGTGRGTDSFDPSVRSKMLAHFNHNKNENQHTRHGEGEGSYYVAATIGSSNNTRGIAEINTCN